MGKMGALFALSIAFAIVTTATSATSQQFQLIGRHQLAAGQQAQQEFQSSEPATRQSEGILPPPPPQPGAPKPNSDHRAEQDEAPAGPARLKRAATINHAPGGQTGDEQQQLALVGLARPIGREESARNNSIGGE